MTPTLTFTCSICGEPSNDICVFCTKDACANHICEKCRRCSDCCECEIHLEDHPETMEHQPAPHPGLPAEGAELAALSENGNGFTGVANPVPPADTVVEERVPAPTQEPPVAQEPDKASDSAPPVPAPESDGAVAPEPDPGQGHQG